jgi:hypothetical protein
MHAFFPNPYITPILPHSRILFLRTSPFTMRRPCPRATVEECFAALPREVLPLVAMHHLEAYAKSKAMLVRETPYAEIIYNAVRVRFEHPNLDFSMFRGVMIMANSTLSPPLSYVAPYDRSLQQYRLFCPFFLGDLIPSTRNTRYTVVIVDLPSTTDFANTPEALDRTVYNDGWRGRMKIVSVSTAVLNGHSLNDVLLKLKALITHALDACP